MANYWHFHIPHLIPVLLSIHVIIHPAVIDPFYSCFVELIVSSCPRFYLIITHELKARVTLAGLHIITIILPLLFS